MNNNKISRQLINGSHEKAFVRLYSLYPKVEKYICINSGSKEEASDIFQEALILTYRKVNAVDFNTSIKIDGFLVNSCKLLWSNELRKKKVRQKVGDTGLDDLVEKNEIQELIEKEEKLIVIDQIIEKIGKKCKDLLEMFYFKNFSMKEIAKKFGYKTIQSAKTKKYKCMEHARGLASEFQEKSQTLKSE